MIEQMLKKAFPTKPDAEAVVEKAMLIIALFNENKYTFFRKFWT